MYVKERLVIVLCESNHSKNSNTNEVHYSLFTRKTCVYYKLSAELQQDWMRQWFVLCMQSVFLFSTEVSGIKNLRFSFHQLHVGQSTRNYGILSSGSIEPLADAIWTPSL